MSLRQALWIRVYMRAARSPPRSEPENNLALRPSAIPLRARSTALLVIDLLVLEEAREGEPAFQHIIHGLSHVGMQRQPCALAPHPVAAENLIRIDSLKKSPTVRAQG